MGVQLDNYKNLTADLNASLKKNIELLTQQKNNTSKYSLNEIIGLNLNGWCINLLVAKSTYFMGRF